MPTRRSRAGEFRVAVAVFGVVCFAASLGSAWGGPRRSVAVTYSFSGPTLETLGTETRVSVAGCSAAGRAGEPALPFRTARILLPPGYAVTGARAVLVQPARPIDARQQVEFGRTPIPFGPDGRLRTLALAAAAKDKPDSRIYGSARAYPSSRVELVSVQSVRGYQVAILRVFPVQYVPPKKQLLCASSVRVELDLALRPAKSSALPLSQRDGSDAAMVAALVDNPDLLAEYRNLAGGAGAAAVKSSGPNPGPMLDDPGPYDYLLITSQALLDSLKFDPLVARKQADGLRVKTATVESIYADPTNDGRDNPERIRNFIRGAWSNWQVQYVLLGGDTLVVPHRGAYACHSSVGVITNLPTDLYYACLDGSWNSDGDTIWGEPTDGEGGADVDLLAEVYVGRAPVETPSEVEAFVSKVVSYEENGTPNADKALLLGEYLGDASYSGTKNQGGDALQKVVLPHLGGFTIQWLDDRPYHSGQWTGADCRAALNQSPQLVAHVGHGSETSVARLLTGDVAALANQHLFLINSTACDSGAFDYSDCIGESFSKLNLQGAFAVIMNTRDGWYTAPYTERYSGEFQGKFFDRLLTQGFTSVGAALQLSKQDMIGKVEKTPGVSSPYRWCYYTITLLGDPHTAVKTFTKRTINVRSFDATPTVNGYFTGVAITFSPQTLHGTSGTTEFTETFGDGTQVTLTAPETANNLRFQHWQLDGVDQPARQQSLAMTMAADHNAVAVYEAPPVLSLVETADSRYVRPGETVTVQLNVSDLRDHEINGVQALLDHDAARLGDPKAVSRSAAPPWNGGTVAGPTYEGSKIDYGIGIEGSTNADAEVATLTFTALSTDGAAYVRFRADEPELGKFTKLTEAPGSTDLFPLKRDAGQIVVDGTNPMVLLTSPNGGEVLHGGDWCQVIWTTTEANPDTLALGYSTDAGNTWTPIATLTWDFGSYWWNLPAVDSDACRVRVTAADKAGNSGQDMSDADFTIASPTLTVKSFNATSAAYFGGAPIGVSPAPDATTEFTRTYISGTTVTLTAPLTHTGLSFVRWRLDGVDQPEGAQQLAVAMTADHEAVAVYQAGGLVVDMEVLKPGTSELNPTGPAPRSLTILSIEVPGDPQTTQIAITTGGGQWLRLVQDAHGNVDAYPTGAAAEWHTSAEWANLRIRGLAPGTTYTFQAKTRDGPGGQESDLGAVGSYSTNADRDVDRSGTVTQADLALVRDAVLGDAVLGHDGKAWATDVSDSRSTTVSDVTLIRNRILGID